MLGGMLAGCTNKEQAKTEENMKQELQLTQEWDKVFPLSEKVNHRKVTFETQYGLTLAADLYTPSIPPKEGRWQRLPFLVPSEPSRSSVADSML